MRPTGPDMVSPNTQSCEFLLQASVFIHVSKLMHSAISQALGVIFLIAAVCRPKITFPFHLLINDCHIECMKPSGRVA